MSNRRYYARRNAGLCPQCGEPVASGVYCVVHRQAHARRMQADRDTDRSGYNHYQRVYQAERKAEHDPT